MAVATLFTPTIHAQASHPAAVALTVTVPLRISLEPRVTPRMVRMDDGVTEFESVLAVTANAPYQLRARHTAAGATALVQDATGAFRPIGHDGLVIASGHTIRDVITVRYRVVPSSADRLSSGDLEIELVAGRPARRITIPLVATRRALADTESHATP